MTAAAERHQQFAATFASVIEATTDWDAQSPVPDWKAKDVVDHLLGWLPPLVSAWSTTSLADASGDTAAERWAGRAAEVQTLLDDPARSAEPVSTGPFAGQPLGDVIDRIYVSDIFMHTWDLARAGGITVQLDPDFARQMLAGMREIESVLRESGQYGPATHTDSTDPVDQLMAFVGRQV
ncbi:TIGR03086 family protein [Calidifontibacter sp. DB0510]|uniref:TIGR03086 family protein n=1 Tax=Metallococcus carri TaxID=1656884 RepID=A0A967E9Z2_9MICO|nr:maleylpyruvate isomerase N-terminal domain-containing protein [Metallococcus carri]NHN56912.1 TIGR03086 family protein [Metallococcus carri]NOP37657.1 TIGR03086 family protein [Calidifontibacter sp. DB2511S]